METYPPIYQSPWPRKEDARPRGLNRSYLESELSLLEDSGDPMELEDLRFTRKLVEFLRRLRVSRLWIVFLI